MKGREPLVWIFNRISCVTRVHTFLQQIFNKLHTNVACLFRFLLKMRDQCLLVLCNV